MGKKGQFFLLGAFILAVLFFVGISSQISPESISFPKTSPLETLFDNVKDEYARALNLGLNESRPIEVLTNFTEFVEERLRERGGELSLLFILTENVSDDVNVTVGNYLGYTINVTLNVSDVTKTLHVPDRGVSYAMFSDPPEIFTLGLNFNTTEKNLLLLEKRKVNLYFILEMRKGENIIKGDVKC